MGDNQAPDRIEVELNAQVDQALDKTKRDIDRPAKGSSRYANLPAADIIKMIERACREITAVLPLMNPTDSTLPVSPSSPPLTTILPQDGRMMEGAKELLGIGVEVLQDLVNALIEKEE
jgi:hypothetical protein